LNAPDPFTKDGWLVTGDAVETDGPFIKILGRQSELVNVGGEKVFPAEVEAVIQGLDNVAEALVFGEANPLLGQIVCARVRLLNKDEGLKDFTRRLKRHCRAHLQHYKVPVKVEVVDGPQHSERFKKVRHLS
jgi:acyl-CoA synthetase (AMP-forming)/AMP-acid ligase II